MNSRAIRIVLPALVLGLFYWTLYLQPVAHVGGESALAPEEARELVESVEANLESGNWQAALEESQRLQDAYPGSDRYVQHAARAYHGLQRYDDEAEAWELFFRIAPRPIDACPALGLAYAKAGARDRSIEALERCRALDADNADSVFFLGRAYERAGDYDRARELFERGFKLAPEYHDMRIGLARISLARGDAGKALSIAASVVQDAPDHPDARLALALALRVSGDLEAAREHLLEGLGRRPTYAGFHRELGRIAELQGRTSDASGHYRRAEDLASE